MVQKTKAANAAFESKYQTNQTIGPGSTGVVGSQGVQGLGVQGLGSQTGLGVHTGLGVQTGLGAHTGFGLHSRAKRQHVPPLTPAIS